MLNLLLFPLRWLAGLRVFRCRECWGSGCDSCEYTGDAWAWAITKRAANWLYAAARKALTTSCNQCHGLGYDEENYDPFDGCPACLGTGRVGLSVWWSQRKSHV